MEVTTLLDICVHVAVLVAAWTVVLTLENFLKNDDMLSTSSSDIFFILPTIEVISKCLFSHITYNAVLKQNEHNALLGGFTHPASWGFKLSSTKSGLNVQDIII